MKHEKTQCEYCDRLITTNEALRAKHHASKACLLAQGKKPVDAEAKAERPKFKSKAEEALWDRAMSALTQRAEAPEAFIDDIYSDPVRKLAELHLGDEIKNSGRTRRYRAVMQDDTVRELEYEVDDSPWVPFTGDVHKDNVYASTGALPVFDRETGDRVFYGDDPLWKIPRKFHEDRLMASAHESRVQREASVVGKTSAGMDPELGSLIEEEMEKAG